MAKLNEAYKPVIKLRPCPFCGAKGVMTRTEFPSKNAFCDDEIPKNARIIRRVQYGDNPMVCEYREPAYRPQCSDSSCVGRSVKMFRSEEEAVRAWNRRAKNGKSSGD